MVKPQTFVVSLHDVDQDDKYLVGERAAHLGKLSSVNFSVLPGFVVTNYSYSAFLDENNLKTKIKHLIGAINFNNLDSIGQVSQHIKKLVKTSKIPDSIINEILGHYERIGASSFSIHANIISGDHEQHHIMEQKYLDEASGDAVLLESVRSSWSELFTPALLIHRHNKNIDHIKTGIATTVQTAISSGVSGKIASSKSNNSKLFIELDSGHNLSIDRITYDVEHHHPEDKPIIYVANGKMFDPSELLSKNEAGLLARIADGVNEHFYFPHEVSWVKDKENFYVTSIRQI